MARARTASSVAAAVGSSPTIAACAHDDDAVGEAQQLGELGGDHQDGDAGGGQLLDQPVDLELGADVDAAGRLVQDQDARLARQPAGEHDLLLVAAGELAHLLLDAGRADAPGGGSARTTSRLSAPRSRKPSRETLSGTHKETLSRTLRRSSRASCLRSSGTRPMPARMASAGRAQSQPPAEDADLAALQPVHAEGGPRQLGPAGTDEAAEAHDLAGPDLQRAAPDPGRGHAAQLQRHLVARPRAMTEQVAQVAADHEPHHRGLVDLGGIAHRHQLAVAQHGDAVGEVDDLAQAMADVDDRRRPRRAGRGSWRTGAAPRPR